LREAQLHTLWPNLKTLVIHKSADLDFETSENIILLASIRLGTGLQHIDFDFRWGGDDGYGPLNLRILTNLFDQRSAHIADLSENDDVTETNDYSELRTMHLSRALIAPERLQLALQQSLTAGRLETLDIVFPLEPIGAAPGATSVQHLRKFAWLRGAPSIRCLGLFDFRFHMYYTGDGDFPLPSFLASFPNLETLVIKSDHYQSEEFFGVLRDVLRANTKIKRVYQKSVQGVALDELKRMTAGAGVELIWGERPREWPMKVDDGRA
jgi:F-box/TPR repeat protein Pof3